jgi:hypothetical protein
MLKLPPEAQILQEFSPAFTKPTFQRFVLLCIAAVVCLGHHTVSRLLWSIRPLCRGHTSSYHRVFSRARWSGLTLSRILATSILKWLPADQPIVVPLDDTTDGPHGGTRVYGKNCWRDAVRSSWTHFATKWGHKWVVLSVAVSFSFCSRLWALPALVVLARPRRLNQKEGHRHKTPAELGRQLLAVLIHWFPQRKFIVLGDGGFASHDLARFCHRHRRHIILVARCRSDMNLYAAPPQWARRQRKGRKLPSPKVSATQGRHQPCTVHWYDRSNEILHLYSDCGGWYRARGKGRAALLPIRWVHSYNPGTHQEDWLFSTEQNLSAKQMVEYFVIRWSLEVTFEELRQHLGLQSTRFRKAASVLRGAPCLFGLFSVVCLIYAQGMKNHKKAWTSLFSWYHKDEPTFSDALHCVRRLFWCSLLLPQGWNKGNVAVFTLKQHQFILERLSAAA